MSPPSPPPPPEPVSCSDVSLLTDGPTFRSHFDDDTDWLPSGVAAAANGIQDSGPENRFIHPPVIETAEIDRVFSLQSSCGSQFRDGRTLKETVQELWSGKIDPMRHDKFVLDAWKVNFRDRRGVAYWGEPFGHWDNILVDHWSTIGFFLATKHELGDVAQKPGHQL